MAGLCGFILHDEDGFRSHRLIRVGDDPVKYHDQETEKGAVYSSYVKSIGDKSVEYSNRWEVGPAAIRFGGESIKYTKHMKIESLGGEEVKYCWLSSRISTIGGKDVEYDLFPREQISSWVIPALLVSLLALGGVLNMIGNR